MKFLVVLIVSFSISPLYSQKRPPAIVTKAKKQIKIDSLRVSNSKDSISFVKICNQLWMTKNLDVVTYRNGDTIPYVWGMSDEWKNCKTGAWCYYSFNSLERTTYGKLYNWYAVNDPRGLAPAGWHIPSNAEWDTLVKCLDPNTNFTCTGCFQSNIAGGAMKESGSAHWFTSQQVAQATNNSGFTALPGGYIQSWNGLGVWMGKYGYFWSSTQSSNNSVFYRSLYWGNNFIEKNTAPMGMGFSVRCVKD